MIFKHAPQKGVINLKPVDTYENHPHVVTTFQYPNRVYAICPICGTYAIVKWKDTRARVWHRTFGALPQIIQVTALFIGLLLLLVLTLLHL